MNGYFSGASPTRAAQRKRSAAAPADGKNGSVFSAAAFLRRRREKALDELHAAERRIDCLDWLLCELARTDAERKESQ